MDLNIVILKEDDGRWFGFIESLPGCMAYGTTQKKAMQATLRLASDVLLDQIENDE